MPFSQFDSKNFNGEVFQRYVDRVPNLKLNELLKSRAIVSRQDLAGAMADQVGGNYLTTPLKGLIRGSTPLNYDGVTDITSQSTQTYSHSRVVVGRAQAWTEKDFSYDITGGVDFMENVAQQVAEYWDEIDQDIIVAILSGIFDMSDVEGAKFADTHTHNITTVQNSEGKTGLMDGTTLNTAIQKACGDHKGAFSLAIMHSKVATNLENMKILVYLKYNDANGMERETGMATLNGRLVLIDDSMPTSKTEVTAGVYTVTLSGTYAANDTVTVAGTTHTVVSGSTSASAIATALATALASNDYYTVSASGGVLTFTENSGYYGTGAPGATVVSTNGKIAVATSTAPVVNTTYTTFVLGDGSIEYTNCGAKVPAEMYRDPKTNGGQDTLYNRQRKCWAPYGISFTKAVMSTLSPTNTELANGSNWELVNTGGSSGKKYIDIKAIPIARIISLG
mgnify:CR=1 FL=1